MAPDAIPPAFQPSVPTTSSSEAAASPATLTAGHGFGTAPVFLASISTILGAVLFLRFGYGVAHAGVLGALAIIVLGHLVTVPTALAIAEIATNRRVEGGGEYFIISRSVGTTIGGSIGIALFLSRAISVAFYTIAFAESFRPLAPWFEGVSGLAFDPRYVSVPCTVVLVVLVLMRGAAIGVQALWLVTAVLGVSLAMFFLGTAPGGETVTLGLLDRVEGRDSFMLVFAILFPAFTGMAAGVGLSGDLENPRRSIPLGTVAATVTGMLVYIAVVFKLAASATPEALAADQLIMSRIAVWGPIIPIGLACATISSAIGSILVAPRTLQALGVDEITPSRAINRFLAHGVGRENEPRHASIVTGVIALVTVLLGNVDFVARIISMFFMVTYGSLCAISFLEYLAARPSYRPSFRSRWYLSLLGALMSLFLMFQMDPFYALLSILIMVAVYKGIQATHGGEDDLAALFKGVMTQTTRHFQIRLQRGARMTGADDWRPSAIMVNSRTFTRSAHVQFFNWLCHRYAFGTYLHFIEGRLDENTYRESRHQLKQLIDTVQSHHGSLFVDTIVSPSVRSALAQSLQVPGVSGMENNTILFEFSDRDGEPVLAEVEEGCHLAHAAHMNTVVLRHGPHFFGARGTLHVWLTWHDYRNADLMILLAYILVGHPDWQDAEIRIFAAFPREEVEEQRARLLEMIATGRLAISEKNLRVIATDDRTNFERLVEVVSAGADLVIFGFTSQRLQEKGLDLLRRHPALRDVLFVSAEQRVRIE